MTQPPADFEPQTRIPAEHFIAQQEQRGVKITHKHCSAIENALREYEHLCYLRGKGEGKELKESLRELEAAIATLIKKRDIVENEPGHFWGYLLGESDAEISGLEQLLKETERLNRAVARPGRRGDPFLDSLIGRLRDIYTEVAGRRATISKGTATKHDSFPGGKGGRFLRFVRDAIRFLPEDVRPKDGGLGSRFERLEKSRGSRSYMWVGGPYPGLAKPWYKNSKARGVTKKEGS